MVASEFRHAVRSLARSKGFFATAVITLGLALGVCTATFAMLDGVRHPYTPIHHADRAFQILPTGAPRDVRSSAYERYRAVRDGSQFASHVALAMGRNAEIRAGKIDRNVQIQDVTPNFLAVMEARPVLGRWFDSAAGPSGSVVLGMAMWQALFPGKTDLAGAAVTIDGQSFNIIGVLPSGFGNIYAPLSDDHAPSPPNRWGLIYARLKPGITQPQAVAQLAIVADRLNQEYGTAEHPFAFRMYSLKPAPVGSVKIDVVLAAVGVLVLIIACANLAGMMLARGIARRREIALKMALGASRSVVIQQLLGESLVIAAAGCAAGVPAAVWGISLIRHEIPQQIWSVGVIAPHLSWRVFAFAVVAASAVGVLVGVLPGILASQVDLNEPLKENSGSTTGRRRQRYSVLAIAQLAMAMTLLMGTALLVRAAHRIAAYDFGFDPAHLVVAEAWLGQADSSRNSGQVFQHLLEVAGRVPGVKGAAVLTGVVRFGNVLSPVFPDHPLPNNALATAAVARATTNFNDVLGVPLVAGRGFEPGDLGTNVAVVDESAGRMLWRGDDPVGHTLKLGSWRSQAPWIRVVGVIRDAQLGFQDDPYLAHTPVIYIPPDARGEVRVQIMARVSGGDATVATALAREMHDALGLKYQPPAGAFVTLAGQEGYAAAHTFIAGLFAFLGAAALGLAAVGLYAVLSYAVSQRRREFAVRLALGATSRALFRLVTHDGLVMMLAGTGIGAFIAMATATVLDRWLYGVYPVDVVALVGAEAVLCVVSFLACLAPARRAMAADPAAILRAV